MSKLNKADKFLDLSDYGRPMARFFAKSLQNTNFTPIHVTLLFGICGLTSIYFILTGHYYLAAVFLILKSVIDAADGELARIKNTPSYSGRYLDSVFDIILNFLIFLTFYYVLDLNLTLVLITFVLFQLQGTLYNYYYVIKRNRSQGGDSTSKIFEYKTPKALPGEKQLTVNILFKCYLICYGVFDRIIHFLDKSAYLDNNYPNWFMTFLSIYGLGFQLLIIAVLLSLNLVHLIVPFFLFFTVFIFIIIGIRKFVLS